MFNEVLQLISSNVKANVKQQEIKDLAVVSLIFLQKVPSKLEIQCEMGVYFSLILAGIQSSGWYSIQHDIAC